MTFGAVITAAGMSTRMKQFKQLMNVGDMSMAEKVINNFLSAGITEIVMVTGFRGDELESALKDYEISFVRNPDYGTTQMFDSAKLGLEKLQSRCERIFFTPVDVPFFKTATVKKLMETEGDLVYPSFNMKKGHPILISSSLIPAILSFDGEGGLKGALANCSAEPIFVNVEDKAMLMDADTQEDFNLLMKLV